MYLAGNAIDYMFIDSNCEKLDFNCVLSAFGDYLNDYYLSYQEYFKQNVSDYDIIRDKLFSKGQGAISLSLSPKNEDLKKVASWLCDGFVKYDDVETRNTYINKAIAYFRQMLVEALGFAYLKKRPNLNLYVARWHNIEVFLREAIINNELLNLESCSDDWLAFEEMEELRTIWDLPDDPPDLSYLPKELKTDESVHYFENAVKKGFVSFSCGTFIWKESKQKLACFAKEMSDRLHLSGTMNGDGSYRTNWQLFENLFNVKNLRYSMGDMKKIKGNPHYDNIDEIFK